MFWWILGGVVLGLILLRIVNVRRLNSMFTNPGFVVFLSAPAWHNLEQLKAKLEPECGPITEAEREDNPEESTFRSHLLIGGHKFTIGTSPRMPDDLRPQFADQYVDPRAKEVIRTCYGGLTVQCFTDGQRATDEHYGILIKVTRLMIDDRAIALGSEPASNVVPLEGKLRKAVDTDDFVTVMQILTAPGVMREVDDEEVEASRQEAQARWSEFVALFPDGGDFHQVKVRFDHEDRTEFMWVNPTDIDASSVRGTLASKPQFTPALRFGSPVEVNLDRVYDWIVMQGDDVVAGGFFDSSS